MRTQAGVSLVELLAVLAIASIGLGIGSLYLRPMEAPLQTAVDGVEGTLREARLKAMATTSAYRVMPQDQEHLVAEFAPGCSAADWTRDERMNLELPDGVSLDSTAWSVCFGSRGVSNSNVVVGLTHVEYGSRSVEVMLGGTTRIVP